MITKTVEGLTWEVVSPSHYILLGYNGIQAKYNGRGWMICGSDDHEFQHPWFQTNAFKDLQDISELIVDICSEYNKGNIAS